MLCSWESPFADCLSGAPNCDYLSRAILPGRGAPITDTAYMGLTSLPMDHDHGNDRTPATRCAIGIKPVAVSLSNAPPTATPSSVMGRFHLVKNLAGSSWVASGSLSGRPVALSSSGELL